MARLKVGSLFSGAGGFDLGFVKGGHTILWALDNDEDSVATYKRNIGPHAMCVDIRGVDFASLEKPDLIIGGFPCQGFSMANKFRNGNDDRNFLYRHFVRSLKELNPLFFLAENVKGILSLEGGSAIKVILKEFSESGYRVDLRLLNAVDFGVPQNRQRVFIFGIREDVQVSHIWPEPLKNSALVTVGQALHGLPEPNEPNNLLNHVCSKYKITNRNFVGCRTTDPNKPSPTIIARGNGKGGVNAIQHPNNHRRMTVREQALVQTFPIDFEFVGSMSSCYRQVGNAVPVKLARAFADTFREAIE
jgi:DNA (cytosine-5)-methyltransferase 1